MLLALMTRNAVVVSPHPMAREVLVEATRLLAQAAVAAGAPDGCIQVVEEPAIGLVEGVSASTTPAGRGSSTMRASASMRALT